MMLIFCRRFETPSIAHLIMLHMTEKNLLRTGSEQCRWIRPRIEPGPTGWGFLLIGVAASLYHSKRNCRENNSGWWVMFAHDNVLLHLKFGNEQKTCVVLYVHLDGLPTSPYEFSSSLLLSVWSDYRDCLGQRKRVSVRKPIGSKSRYIQVIVLESRAVRVAQYC